MPGMSGLELLRQVNQFWNGTKTIVLTAYPEFRYAYEVFRQYGAGYLLKTEEKEVILQTITHTLEQIGRERLASFSSDPFTDQPSVPSDGMHQDRDIPLREADLLRALHFHGSGNLLMILCAAAGCTQYASGSLQDLPSALCRLLRLHFRQMIRSSFCYQDSHGHLLFLAELSERIPEAQAADGWISGILENIQDILVSTGPRLPFLYGTSASLADVFSLYQTAMTRLSDTAQPSSASWIFCLDSSSAPAEEPSSLVEYLKNYIEAHAAEDLSLLQLSEITGYNASYISWLFHSETGIRLSRYISRKKMDLIDSYFLKPSLTINDIIEKTGFHSRRYFNIFIKRETGMIPKEYRARLLQKQASEITSQP